MSKILALFLAASLAFAQAPVEPVQPNQVSFSPSELQLFPTYSRESYRAKFGTAAPACNPARALKNWFDLTVDYADAPSEVALYKVISRDTKNVPSIRQLALTNFEAASLNLPGREQYPAYKPSPTTAAVTNTTGTYVFSYLDPALLATRAQADHYAQLFGGTVEEETRGGDFPYLFPPTEPRRLWLVVSGKNKYYAGDLVAKEYQNGVGAPGAWVPQGNGDWAWIVEQVPDCVGKTESRPVPVRALQPNEVLSNGVMGPLVFRTDLQQPPDKTGTTWTAADRALLEAIAAKLGVSVK